jgi:hypothetical protein
MGGDRICRDVRRVADARRAGRRHSRPAAHVQRRHTVFHPRLAARRLRHSLVAADHRPRAARRRRGPRSASGTIADHGDVPRGKAPHEGPGHVRGDDRSGRRGRRGSRRAPHHLRVLAVGVLRQRSYRAAARLRRPVRHTGVTALSPAVGPARRHHRHGRIRAAHLRSDPRRDRARRHLALGRHWHNPRPGRRRRRHSRVRHHRSTVPPAAAALADLRQPEPDPGST